jgi:Holliday junction resolvase RusA-like endonuclease
MIEFKIPGPPTPKGRPRLGRHGVYTPQKTKDAEALCKWFARSNCNLMSGPLSMKIRFGMPIPKSYSKKKRAEISAGRLHHMKTPDLDNLAKLVLDALNGIAYDDDKQIIELTVSKFYAETPGTVIKIKEWK